MGFTGGGTEPGDNKQERLVLKDFNPLLRVPHYTPCIEQVYRSLRGPLNVLLIFNCQDFTQT